MRNRTWFLKQFRQPHLIFMLSWGVFPWPWTGLFRDFPLWDAVPIMHNSIVCSFENNLACLACKWRTTFFSMNQLYSLGPVVWCTNHKDAHTSANARTHHDIVWSVFLWGTECHYIVHHQRCRESRSRTVWSWWKLIMPASISTGLILPL